MAYCQLGTGQVQLQTPYFAAQPMVVGQHMVAGQPVVTGQQMVAAQPLVAIPVSSQ